MSANEIREFQLSDMEAATSLLEELGYPCGVPALAARVAPILESGRDFILVATHQGRPVGLASVHLIPMVHRDGSVARLTAFVVTENMRGQRLGSSLLDACERDARARGAERMELTSGDARAGAHAFYETRGFQREGQRFTKRLASDG